MATIRASVTLALICDTPWGDDVRAGAQSAVQGDLALVGLDGFVIGRVTSVSGAPSQEIAVEAAAVIDHAAAATFQLGVSGKSLAFAFQVGHDYFIPLYRSSDSGVAGSLVHPCGPVVELVGPADARALLAGVAGGEVVSQSLLDRIGAAKADPSQTGVPAALAIPILAGVIAIGVAGIAFRPRRTSDRRLWRAHQ